MFKFIVLSGFIRFYGFISSYHPPPPPPPFLPQSTYRRYSNQSYFARLSYFFFSRKKKQFVKKIIFILHLLNLGYILYNKFKYVHWIIPKIMKFIVDYFKKNNVHLIFNKATKLSDQMPNSLPNQMLKNGKTSLNFYSIPN